MLELADRAGGDAPRPERPGTTIFNEIRLAVGNEQIMALYNSREELKNNIDLWQEVAGQIEKRMPSWLTLQKLLSYCGDLKAALEIHQQGEAIEHQRLLLADPDPIQPILQSLEQELRKELNDMDVRYESQHTEGMKRLQADSNWQQLEPEQRNQLLAKQKLTNPERPEVNLQSTQEILTTLSFMPLPMFSDRLAAMKGRFDLVLEEAAELMEPEAQFIYLPRTTMKTEEKIDQWLIEVREKLVTALDEGPVMIK